MGERPQASEPPVVSGFAARVRNEKPHICQRKADMGHGISGPPATTSDSGWRQPVFPVRVRSEECGHARASQHIRRHATESADASSLNRPEKVVHVWTVEERLSTIATESDEMRLSGFVEAIQTARHEESVHLAAF